MEYKKLELGGKKLYQHTLYFSAKTSNNYNLYAIASYIDNNPLVANNTLQPSIDFLSTNGFTSSSSLYAINGVMDNGNAIIGVLNNKSNLTVKYYSDRTLYSHTIQPTDLDFICDTVIQLN